jgi:hypothetical protein
MFCCRLGDEAAMLPPTRDRWKFWRPLAEGGDGGDAEAAAPVAEEVG